MKPRTTLLSASLLAALGLLAGACNKGQTCGNGRIDRGETCDYRQNPTTCTQYCQLNQFGPGGQFGTGGYCLNGIPGQFCTPGVQQPGVGFQQNCIPCNQLGGGSQYCRFGQPAQCFPGPQDPSCQPCNIGGFGGQLCFRNFQNPAQSYQRGCDPNIHGPQACTQCTGQGQFPTGNTGCINGSYSQGTCIMGADPRCQVCRIA